MTVREFLALWADNIDVRIFQTPIKKIDKCSTPVIRQTGDVDTLLHSNQNFLDFKIVNLQMDYDLICVVCGPNEKQISSIINAHLYGK